MKHLVLAILLIGCGSVNTGDDDAIPDATTPDAMIGPDAVPVTCTARAGLYYDVDDPQGEQAAGLFFTALCDPNTQMHDALHLVMTINGEAHYIDTAYTCGMEMGFGWFTPVCPVEFTGSAVADHPRGGPQLLCGTPTLTCADHEPAP